MRFLLLLLIGLPLITQGQSLLLRHAHVVGVDSAQVRRDQDLWIDGDSIRAIFSSGQDSVAADTVIDLAGRYLMPGLVDGHVHFFQSGGLYTRPDVIDLRALRPYAADQSWLAKTRRDRWRRYLAAGITMAMDLGGPMRNYDLRDQADSLPDAPQLTVTGPLLSSYQPEALSTDDPPILQVNSVEEARRAVRRQLPYQPDYLKIWYIVRRGESPATFFPIAQAICAEAHAAAVPVAVHATQLETARYAVRAGADLLVHSVDDRRVDSSLVQMVLDSGVYYCPTLTVSHSYTEVLHGVPDLRPGDWRWGQAEVIASLLDLRTLSAEQRPAWADRLLAAPLPVDAQADIRAHNLRAMADAGVPIITGTDAGNIGTLHVGSYQEELMAMRQAGLYNPEILRASTQTAADFLGQKAGRVAVGYRADLLVLAANPLDDLSTLAKPVATLRRGRLYRPSDLVQRDEEAVLSLWFSALRSGDEAALQGFTHPAVIFQDQGRRWVGRQRVSLLLQRRRLPAAVPAFQAGASAGQWQVRWGKQQMTVRIRGGRVRQIDW